MSKRYRLIQTYPGSGPLGKEVVSHELYAEYPHLWEEIIEKDYEILSFKATRTGTIYVKRYNGRYKNDTLYVEYSEDKLLNSNDYTIHSIKRLLDGERFTVGDKVGYSNNHCNKPLEITAFEVMNDILFLRYVGNSISKWFDDWNCKNFNHVKTPLFTTEDDVDICEGDKYYAIVKSNLTLRKKSAFYALREKPGIVPLWTEKKSYLTFSTRKAAEEYILLNKPCLSILDVSSVFPSAMMRNKNRMSGWSRHNAENMQALVKKKMDGKNS